MRSSLKAVGLAAALAATSYAQSSSSPSPNTTNEPLAAPSDVSEIISELAPTITSLPASQFSKFYTDVNVFYSSIIDKLPENPALTAADITGSLLSALEGVDTMTNPTAALASVSALVSGLPEASAIVGYESTLLSLEGAFTTQLIQLVQSDLSVSVVASPSPTNGPSSGASPGAPTTTTASSSSSSGLAAAPTASPGLMMGAVAAAAGVVGMAML